MSDRVSRGRLLLSTSRRFFEVCTLASALVAPTARGWAIQIDQASPRAGERRRPPSLADYYRILGVRNPAISPDGRRVAFVQTRILEQQNRTHSEVWLVGAHEPTPPTRLTSQAFDAANPVWSPDGRLLAFTSDRHLRPDDGAASSIWFLRMDRPRGEGYQIDGVTGTPVFGPGNQWIAFTQPTPPRLPPEQDYRSAFHRKIDERFDGRMYDWMNYRFDRRGYLADPRDPRATPPEEIYVASREGGGSRQLTDLGFDAEGIAWRPDGGALAFTADAHQRDEYTYERADLWVVDLDGNTRRLTDDGYHYRDPAWSPDGDWIAVLGSAGLDMVIAAKQAHGAPLDLYVVPARGGAPRNITPDWDFMAGAPRWSPDGRFIYFRADAHGSTHLFRISPDGGPVEQVTQGDRRLGGVSFSNDFQRIAYQASDPTHPGDVFLAHVDGSNERQLTDVNAAFLAEVQLTPAEKIRYSSADGTAIEGWIMSPRDPDPSGGLSPLILSIHGGPHSAYRNDFDFHRQLLAASGYFVLFTNPRGSIGYGDEFKWAIWGGWGVLDYQDLMAGVDYVLQRYPADEARLGVTGGSYGGFMTNWVIGHTQRFAAAVARASISNWFSDYGVADIPRTKESEFFGPPWEKESRDLLIELSPLTYAGNVSTPTLFLHGELDLRVPIEEAEQMYVALKKRQVPARFIRYPESYHGGWTPWRMVHRMHYELQWWGEWLGREPRINE